MKSFVKGKPVNAPLLKGEVELANPDRPLGRVAPPWQRAACNFGSIRITKTHAQNLTFQRIVTALLPPY
jgi:hypothetical protein